VRLRGSAPYAGPERMYVRLRHFFRFRFRISARVGTGSCVRLDLRCAVTLRERRVLTGQSPLFGLWCCGGAVPVVDRLANAWSVRDVQTAPTATLAPRNAASQRRACRRRSRGGCGDGPPGWRVDSHPHVSALLAVRAVPGHAVDVPREMRIHRHQNLATVRMRCPTPVAPVPTRTSATSFRPT